MRCIVESSLCLMSMMDEETAIHCLRDCCLTQILWKGIIPILANVFLFAGDKSGWLMMNLDAGAMFPPYWPRKFGIVLDLIWQWRNFFVFNGALGSDCEMMMKITKLEKELNYECNKF